MDGCRECSQMNLRCTRTFSAIKLLHLWTNCWTCIYRLFYRLPAMVPFTFLERELSLANQTLDAHFFNDIITEHYTLYKRIWTGNQWLSFCRFIWELTCGPSHPSGEAASALLTDHRWGSGLVLWNFLSPSRRIRRWFPSAESPFMTGSKARQVWRWVTFVWFRVEARPSPRDTSDWAGHLKKPRVNLSLLLPNRRKTVWKLRFDGRQEQNKGCRQKHSVAGHFKMHVNVNIMNIKCNLAYVTWSLMLSCVGDFWTSASTFFALTKLKTSWDLFSAEVECSSSNKRKKLTK